MPCPRCLPADGVHGAREDADTDADTELSHCLRQSSPPIYLPLLGVPFL